MNSVQKRTLREIDRRVEAPREINGAEMRASMRRATQRISVIFKLNWIEACGKDWKGKDGLASLSILEIENMMYADAWCRAYGKVLRDYTDQFGLGRSARIS